MRGILFPNSNIIFDTQDTDPGAPPDPAAAGSNPYAGTYGGWEAVENASMALAEAANLIALPGRVCQNNKPVPLDDPVYQKGLAALREVAQLSYETAKAKETTPTPCWTWPTRSRRRALPATTCSATGLWTASPLGWKTAAPRADRIACAFVRASRSHGGR